MKRGPLHAIKKYDVVSAVDVYGTRHEHAEIINVYENTFSFIDKDTLQTHVGHLIINRMKRDGKKPKSRFVMGMDSQGNKIIKE